MQTWLKTLGSADGQMPEDWFLGHQPHLVDEDGFWKLKVAFPRNKKPTGMEIDDLLVIYLSGWQRIGAVTRVRSGITEKTTFGKQWPWVIDTEPLLVVPHVADCPDIRETLVDTLSVRNQSHIRLSPEAYRSCVQALASTVALAGEVYVPAYPRTAAA